MKLPTRFCRWLLPHVWPDREADVFIGGRENPYLERWHLIPRNRWLNVYFHHIRRSDDDRAPHTHPWHSLSLMLGGSMREVRRMSDGADVERVIRRGELVWRGPSYAHRLVIDDTSALTLFITGPKVAEWFFLCPQGRVHWRAFTDPTDTGKIGRGCGEA